MENVRFPTLKKNESNAGSGDSVSIQQNKNLTSILTAQNEHLAKDWNFSWGCDVLFGNKTNDFCSKNLDSQENTI